MASEHGLRLARQARRKGGSFPRFADDDVVQELVEEALAVKLERTEAEQAEQAAREQAVSDAERRVQETLKQLRKGGAA